MLQSVLTWISSPLGSIYEQNLGVRDMEKGGNYYLQNICSSLGCGLGALYSGPLNSSVL